MATTAVAFLLFTQKHAPVKHYILHMGRNLKMSSKEAFLNTPGIYRFCHVKTVPCCRGYFCTANHIFVQLLSHSILYHGRYQLAPAITPKLNS